MIPRVALGEVREALARQAAVALIGPRQVGKTTLALEIAGGTDALYLDLLPGARGCRGRESARHCGEAGALSTRGMTASNPGTVSRSPPGIVVAPAGRYYENMNAGREIELHRAPNLNEVTETREYRHVPRGSTQKRNRPAPYCWCMNFWSAGVETTGCSRPGGVQYSLKVCVDAIVPFGFSTSRQMSNMPSGVWSGSAADFHPP